MPVTVTAKRALRSSARKAVVNSLIISRLEVAIRQAKSHAAKGSAGQAAIQKAMSLADRAAKKRVIHKNKAARIKSALSKLTKPVTKLKTVSKAKKVTSKKK